MDGRILGQHRGVMYYTIGQRRGLGLGDDTGTDPLFVVGIDAQSRQVIVGPRSALERDTLWLENINWLGEGDFGTQLDGLEIRVKVRSTRPPALARFKSLDGEMVVTLAEPDLGLSPGQACVFYEDRQDAARTLGGGWITRTG